MAIPRAKSYVVVYGSYYESTIRGSCFSEVHRVRYFDSLVEHCKLRAAELGYRDFVIVPLKPCYVHITDFKEDLPL